MPPPTVPLGNIIRFAVSVVGILWLFRCLCEALPSLVTDRIKVRTSRPFMVYNRDNA